MTPFRCAVAATATVMLSACGVIPYEGQGDYPSAGPPPPPGTEWRTDDGAAGVKLGADGTAEVWGFVAFVPPDTECDPRDLRDLHGHFEYEFLQDPLRDEIRLKYDVSGIAGGQTDTQTAQLFRLSSAPGWSTLMYQPCHLFNDGNELELHLVE